MPRTSPYTPAEKAIRSAATRLKRLASQGRFQRPPLKQNITVIRPDGSRLEVSRTVNVDRPDMAPEVTVTEVPAAVVVAPLVAPAAPAVAMTVPPVVPEVAPEMASAAVLAPITTSDSPTVTYRTSDGKPVVIVSLLGKHALGQHICLEPADWERVSRDHGTRWFLQSDGKACGYVRGGKGGRLHLARLVMEAKLGEMVEFQHRRKVGKLTVGLDFRRANLKVGPALPQRKPRSVV